MTAKVFVGNLVFSTTDEDLKQAFSSAAPVLSANIITRGRRSLGYGFVEFASEADAEKAVAAMNKKEISGRPINVEVARPRDPVKEEEARERKAARAAKPRAPKAEGASEVAATGEASDSPSANRRRRGTRRGGRKSDGAAASSAPGAEGSAAPAAEANGAANGARNNGRRAAAGTRAPRPRQPKRPAESRPASDTTLFVANVPFMTDDAALLALFQEYKPKSAHVVRMRNGRSRGYGFVEFEDKAGQTAGLAVNDKEVPLPNGSSMKLSVKVAMTPPVPSSPQTDAAPAASAETPQN